MYVLSCVHVHIGIHTLGTYIGIHTFGTCTQVTHHIYSDLMLHETLNQGHFREVSHSYSVLWRS